MNEIYTKYWSNPWVLSISSGILLGLSFPPFPFPFLIIPAFLLLFRLCDISQSYRQVAYYSYPAFLIWNIIGTYWLTFATLSGGIAAIVANAVLMTIPLVLIRYARENFTGIGMISILSGVIWVAYEFLHHRWDLSWPWLTLGNAFSNSIWIVQYISFTGSLGISFWIVVSTAFIGYWLADPNRIRLIAAAIAFLLPMLISVIMYFSVTIEEDDQEYIRVAIIQPNYDSYLNMAGYDDPVTPLVELLSYTDSLLQQNPANVVYWPENALQRYILEQNTSQLDRHIRGFVGKHDIPLITGSSFIRMYDDTPELYRGFYAGQPVNLYNAALAYYPDRKMDYYLKAKLVPIVERLPFVEFLNKADVFSDTEWGKIAGFGRGRETNNFKTGQYYSPAMVCYDSVFSDWVRNFTLQGANYLTVITNDGWWGNTSGHIQHFDYARLRSIENRRTVLRSANNGISGVILANGDVAVKTEYWTRDGFVYNVPVYDSVTFYVKYGDWLGLLSVLGTFFMLSFATYRKLLK